jgi:V/A-type H+-transporting ATPase subunit I
MSQFTTQGMSRLTAAGMLGDVDEAIQILADLNAVHVVDYSGDEEGLNLGKPNPVSEKIGRDLNRYRSVISQIATDDVKVPLEATPIRHKMRADLPTLVDEMLGAGDRIDAIESEESAIAEESAALKILEPLGIDLDLLSGYESVTAFVGSMKDTSAAKYATAGGLVIRGGEKSSIVAAFCRNEQASAVQSALDEAGFVSETVPAGSGNITGRLTELSERASSLSDEKHQLQTLLEDWGDNNGATLQGGVELLERDMSMALCPVRVATSDHAFVIDGWVETARSDEVKSALSNTCLYVDTEKFKITPGGGGHGHHGPELEMPPIKFADRHKSKPMELITDLMGRPSYGKVDPTIFMFITYPLFFGLMLGDMAYGFVTMGVGYALYRAKGHDETMLLAAKFLAYIGGATVIFGYIYGEFAGFEILPHGHCDIEAIVNAHACEVAGGHWGWAESTAPAWATWPTIFYPNGGGYHWSTAELGWFAFAGIEHGLPFGMEMAYPFHRVTMAGDGGNLEDLILLTIYMGVFHTLLGLGIGFRDTWKYGDSHGNVGPVVAFFDKGCWIAILVGGFFFAYAFLGLKGDHGAGYSDFLSSMQVIGAAIAAVGVLMLIYASYKYHGMPPAIAAMLGPIEGIGMMSTVVSYVRLFAVGIVGVKIAETGNHMLYGYIDGDHGVGLVGLIADLDHANISGFILAAILLPVILPFALKLMKISISNAPLGLDSFGRQFLLGFLISGGLGFAFGVGSSIFMLLSLFFGWLVVQGFAWLLGVVSPNIHAARLHLVEWMKQFYEVAGEKFAPFGFSARSVEVE